MTKNDQGQQVQRRLKYVPTKSLVKTNTLFIQGDTHIPSEQI